MFICADILFQNVYAFLNVRRNSVSLKIPVCLKQKSYCDLSQNAVNYFITEFVKLISIFLLFFSYVIIHLF